jgi:cell division protein FtsI/penicillin-binding protein 2
MKFKKDDVRFTGTKEIETQIKNQTENVISRRFYLMIGFIVVVGIIMIINLFIKQIKNQEYYDAKLSQYNTSVFQAESLRGNIYDRNYKRLVYNKKVICATYYNVKGIKSEEIDVMINYLIDNVNIDTSSITDREKKDYLIKKDEDYVNSLITDEENKAISESDDSTNDKYQIQLNKITSEILEEKLTDYDLKYYKLLYAINNCTQGSATLIEGLTVKEASLIGENSYLLRGVKVTTDWVRAYEYGDLFKSVLGSVTTKKQGLPLSKKDLLLAKDYNNDSRVGTSGLEQEYEDILAGKSATYQLSYDNDGNPILNTVDEGEKGADIQLTIDWDLQEKISAKIEELLIKDHEKYHDHIYVILTDPNNGEILAMCGKKYTSEGKVVDWASGSYLESYRMGSSVKGGTLYTMFKNNIIEANHYEKDEALKIQGTSTKSSHGGSMGTINEVTALERSSNVYMFKLAIKLGGDEYEPNMKLNVDLSAFDTFRNALGDLGLGVKTQLDVPYEETGVKGVKEAGKLLDEAIGQYDTYTTVQLAQYISTIANDGIKVQPHLFKSSFNKDDEGNTVTLSAHQVKVLDDLTEYATAFKQIKKGMYQVVNGSQGTASSGYKPSNSSLAGKTGTAEDYTGTGNVDKPNHMFVGYSPTDNPQIAIACMSERQTTSKGNACKTLTKYSLEEYFKKYNINSD